MTSSSSGQRAQTLPLREGIQGVKSAMEKIRRVAKICRSESDPDLSRRHESHPYPPDLPESRSITRPQSVTPA